MKVWRVSRERTKWIAAANGILVTSTHCHTHKHSHAPKILNWFRMATDGCWAIVIVYAFSNNSRWCSRETERHHQNSIEHTIQLRSTRNISFKMVHTRLNRQVSNRTRCPEHTTKRTAIDYLIRYYCSITAHKIESSTEKKTDGVGQYLIGAGIGLWQQICVMLILNATKEVNWKWLNALCSRSYLFVCVLCCVCSARIAEFNETDRFQCLVIE